MLRRLLGLNEQDAFHELQGIGLSSPDPVLVKAIQENFAVKVFGFNPAHILSIISFLRQFKDVAVIASSPETDQSGFIFYVSLSFVPVLRYKISGKAAAENSQFRKEFEILVNNETKHEWTYAIPGGRFKIDHPVIMGVLNVTPDSFSDGGRYFSADAGYGHALEMLEAGAEIIDIGGESTRPGAESVPLEEEWARVSPIIKRLVRQGNAVISIDTYKSEIARRALNEGAHIINDISGMTFDSKMAEVAAEYNVPVILMHLKGTPKTMQVNPTYTNLMEEILVYLAERCKFALDRGVRQLVVDPGIGFGKRANDNFELIRRLGEFCVLGYPVLLGVSRKSFIGRLLDTPVEERLAGTITSVLYGVSQGANILRVHDVKEIRQSLKVYGAIRKRKTI